MALRSKIGIEKEDREICIGDILNKGPKSIELLRYLRTHNIPSIRGNHEDKFIRYHLHEIEFLVNGKKNPMKLGTLEQEIYRSLNKKDLEFLFSLPLFMRIGRLTLVHGGILPGTRLESMSKKEAAQVMRVRYVDEEGRFVHLDEVDPSRHFYWSELYDGRYGYVVYGHQPFLKPRIDRFSFGIDTGAVYGNELTAIIFEEAEPERYSFVSLKTRTYATKKRPWEIANL